MGSIVLNRGFLRGEMKVENRVGVMQSGERINKPLQNDVTSFLEGGAKPADLHNQSLFSMRIELRIIIESL